MSLAENNEKAFITTSPWLSLSNVDKMSLQSKMLGYTKLAKKKKYNKGSYLFNAGDMLEEVYFLKEGIVQGSIIDINGTEKILTFSDEFCFLGEEVLFHHQPVLYNAYAVTDIEAYIFAGDVLINILKENFDLSYYLMCSMAIRVRVLANQIEDILFRSTLEKVVRILYYYSSMEEKNNFTIAHRNLAAIVGAHRVTITNVIAELKEQGIVETEYGKIIIKDKNALKEMVFPKCMSKR